MRGELIRALYTANAIHFRKEREPQTDRFLVPVYCDVRALLGEPAHRTKAARALANLAHKSFPTVEALIGIVTGGIPYAVLAAEQMSLSAGYVRSQAKAHGLARQIEGMDVRGREVVLVDDLITSGSSICLASQLLRDAGACVLGAVGVFSYDFPAAGKRFSAAGIPVCALITMEELIHMGEDEGRITSDMVAHIRMYTGNPRAEIWAKK